MKAGVARTPPALRSPIGAIPKRRHHFSAHVLTSWANVRVDALNLRVQAGDTNAALNRAAFCVALSAVGITLRKPPWE